MNKFFVGQRVRVITAFFPENIGREAFIVEMFDERDSLEPGWPVNCRISGLSRGNANHTDRLEPILPEGAVKGDLTFQQLMDELKRIEA